MGAGSEREANGRGTVDGCKVADGMRFGVLGTGMVGRAIGGRLVELGHEVKMGSRRAGSEKAVAWASEVGDRASQDRAGEGRASEGSFADAAAFGEMVVNATAGGASIEALEMAGADNLAGKVLIDVANPLDFSRGMPPTLSVCNEDSLGERIQRTFPEARVVKALNTVNASVMVAPGALGESTSLFVCGDDEGAKAEVEELLRSFGWGAGRVLDLGDISAARGAEMYLPLWLRIFGALGTSEFNIAIVRGD
jgi:predicted dinucleotide-binding enzyme